MRRKKWLLGMLLAGAIIAVQAGPAMACSVTLKCPGTGTHTFSTPDGSIGGSCTDQDSNDCVGYSYSDSGGAHSITACCADYMD